MPDRITKKRLSEFIVALENTAGSSGNGSLRNALGWDEDFYWKVQGRLIEDGRIVPGRGKGGSVRLTEAETVSSIKPETNLEKEGPSKYRERDLYAPLKVSIETRWINRFGFDEFSVDETHTRGAKDTGGTFTRPDITAAGVRRYMYLPKRLEIVTFEVKSRDAVGIIGILEAIAHREAAHRAYAIYAVNRADFEGSAEAERILELGQKHGVGIILTEDPSNVEGWEMLLDAIRHEPDPARLDRFLGDLPSEAMRKKLSKWKE